MATYKVIQDIEAEDKLLGPLSLRQFIYAVIVVALGFVMFTLAKTSPLLIIPFVLPAILFGFLAAPFGHDQSSEVWLLAKIRFMLKPRNRVWNQAGLQELVAITAPKKIERILTNGLDQYQVQSRLQALARTIDTRGWAVKGVDVNMLMATMPQTNDSDRLIGMQNFAPAVPDYDISLQDDILDENNNAVAQQVDQMIQASTAAHRQELMQRMTQPDPSPATIMTQPTQTPATPMYTLPVTNYAAPYNTPVAPTTTQTALQPAPAVPTNNSSVDEAALLNQIHEQEKRESASLGRMRTLQAAQTPTAPTPSTTNTDTQTTSVTQTPDAGILKLANNDDLTVATIARQVHKNDPPANNEVVISLH